MQRYGIPPVYIRSGLRLGVRLAQLPEGKPQQAAGADAHNLPFENGSFDVVTALQCWVYFDKEKLLPELRRILKKDGSLYIMLITWLSDEDEIIRKSFELVKRYNPNWSGFMKRADRLDFHWLNKDFSVETVI